MWALMKVVSTLWLKNVFQRTEPESDKSVLEANGATIEMPDVGMSPISEYRITLPIAI